METPADKLRVILSFRSPPSASYARFYDRVLTKEETDRIYEEAKARYPGVIV